MRITDGWAAFGHALLLHIALVASVGAAGEISEQGAEQGPDNTTKPYVKPKVEGLHWVETFDGDVWSRWAHSKHERYNGKLKVQERAKEALIGDLGLLVPEEARHYGAAVSFPPLEGKANVPFIMQFEAKFQDGLTCGGSYLKLFSSEGKSPSGFQDDTRYVIMFGPDRCGGTDKVHFILQHKSPKTGRWEEKHNKDHPATPHDQLTHLYRLVINPDNSFEIHVDGEKKSSGSLLSSMEPPINPPKEIDDPTDFKPADWVDEAKMDDPMASKPDDWDEDAPMQIPDPKATMPSGWKEDAPKRIPDPAAKVPEDWDEEEDGEWEAPIIDNPECKVGCGKWEPPKISNPAYKGKWYAPKIDNPAYQGVWKARQIANPDFFVDDTPCILPTIDSVGIDIWTMSKGIIFDNMVISTDLAKAKAFADESWKLRNEIEKLQEPKSTSGHGSWWDFVLKNAAAIAITSIVVLATSMWCCCFRRSSDLPAEGVVKAKKMKRKQEEKQRKEAEAKEKEKEQLEGEQQQEEDEKEENEETQEGGGDADGRGASEPASTAKTPVEGGLGDIGGSTPPSSSSN